MSTTDDTEEPGSERDGTEIPALSGDSPPVPQTRPSAASVQRRRRRSSGRTGRRHRDLTPEEDNRRRQREAIIKILPGILAVIGGLAWMAGSWNADQYQHHKGLIRTGQVFLAIGAGFYAVLLLREWIGRLRAARKERAELLLQGIDPKASRRSASHHRRQKHRSPKPSGVRPS